MERRLKFPGHPADSTVMNDKQALIWEVLYWRDQAISDSTKAPASNPKPKNNTVDVSKPAA